MTLTVFRTVLPLTILFLCLCAPAGAQFYCSFEAKTTDKGTISLHDLMSDAKQSEQGWRNAQFYRTKIAELEASKSAKSTETQWQNDYAVTLFEMGRREEAKKIWLQQIKENAINPEALGNLSNAAEKEGDFVTAKTYAERLVAAHPNLRGGAEKYRLLRLTYLVDTTTAHTPQTTTAVAPFWIPDMLKAWEARPSQTESKWKNISIPPQNMDGLIEMLAYSPKFGDGWHVLAMALEADGNLKQASLAYSKALLNRATQRKTIEPYDAQLRDYLLKHYGSSKIRNNALWFFGTVVLLLVLRKGYSVYKNARENIDFYRNR